MGDLVAKQSRLTAVCRVTAAAARFQTSAGGLPFAHVTRGQSRARIWRCFLPNFDNYISKLSIHVNLRPLFTSPDLGFFFFPWFRFPFSIFHFSFCPFPEDANNKHRLVFSRVRFRVS